MRSVNNAKPKLVSSNNSEINDSYYVLRQASKSITNLQYYLEILLGRPHHFGRRFWRLWILWVAFVHTLQHSPHFSTRTSPTDRRTTCCARSARRPPCPTCSGSLSRSRPTGGRQYGNCSIWLKTIQLTFIVLVESGPLGIVVLMGGGH